VVAFSRVFFSSSRCVCFPSPHIIHSWLIARTLIVESVRLPFCHPAPSDPLTRPIIDYKAKALKQDELRKRREEQQVEIRRQKREENIAKRRNFVATSAVDSDEEASSGAWESPVRLYSPSLPTAAYLFGSSTRT
jgi:hypothetical protein